MRWLDVRRHSATEKGAGRGRGSHLSADGVALARAVGAGTGPYGRVVTSTVPRTLETAVAMGFAVDETVEMPPGHVAGEVAHHEQWRWPRPYERYAELVRRGGGVAALAAAHGAIWLRAVRAVPDGGAALVVAHGGMIEPTLVACLPDADHAAWPGPFGHCDGARLGHDGTHWTGVEFRPAGGLSPPPP